MCHWCHLEHVSATSCLNDMLQHHYCQCWCERVSFVCYTVSLLRIVFCSTQTQRRGFSSAKLRVNAQFGMFVFWRQLVRKDPIFILATRLGLACRHPEKRRNGEAENVVCASPCRSRSVSHYSRDLSSSCLSRHSVPGAMLVYCFCLCAARRAWLDLLRRLVFNLVKSARNLRLLRRL